MASLLMLKNAIPGAEAQQYTQNRGPDYLYHMCQPTTLVEQVVGRVDKGWGTF